MNLNLIEVPFEILKGSNPYIVNPMTSQMEKAILEYSVMTDDKLLIFNNICRMLKVPNELPFELKLAWIYKVREISFGSDFNIGFQCSKCKQYTQSVILLEDLLEWKAWESLPEDLKYLEMKDAGIKDILDSSVIQCLDFFKDPNISKLPDLARYAFAAKSRIPRLKKTLSSKCLICQHPKEIQIDNISFLIDSLSDYNCLGMFKIYNILAMNGFSKACVDSMLPFERDVQVSLCKERTSQILEN